MAFTDIGGMPLMMLGGTHRQGVPVVITPTNVIMDAVNEATICLGYVFNPDFGSHTISAGGTSRLQWRAGPTTYVNSTSSLSVGIATVDLSVGPPGRAVNVADVITFDVACVIPGTTPITTNSWQSHTPTTGSKTIAHGDLVAFAIQMTARGGVDSVISQHPAVLPTGGTGLPSTTSFVGGAYASTNQLPNVLWIYSDGTIGYLFGSNLQNTATTTLTYNSSTTQKEYGNRFTVNSPMRVYGINGSASLGGNAEFVLYRNAGGVPVQMAVVAVDANTIGLTATTNSVYTLPLLTPQELFPGEIYAVAIRPTTTTNMSVLSKTFADTTNTMYADGLGSNSWAVTRTSLTGSYTNVNSGLDRLPLGVLVSAIPHPATPTFQLGL